MTAQVLELFPDISPSQVDPPNRTVKKKRDECRSKVKGKPAYTPEFENFWQAYPPRFNSSKLDAFTAWQRLDDEDRALIMEVMPTFITWARTKEEKHLPHASTWINGRRFETIRRPATVPSLSAPQVDWAKAKRIFEATGRWAAELGPEPGAPGSRCL